MALSDRLQVSKESILYLTADQRSVLAALHAKLEDGTYPMETVPCFCGAADGFVVAQRDRYGLPVNTLLCLHCGILRTSPRMTKEAADAFYRCEYRALYSGAIPIDTFFARDVLRGRQLLASLPNLLRHTDVVYDIGCGSGGMLLPLKESGKTAWGCDTNQAFLAYGRAQGLDLIQGCAQDIVAQTGRLADLVILSHCIEHFYDLSAELTAITQVLRDDGLILAYVPGVRAIDQQPYDGDILRFLQNAHTYHFSEATLTYVLQSIGLEIVASDESAFAAARRPIGWKPGCTPVPIPTGEATALQSYLTQMEQRFQSRASALPNHPTANTFLEPWPLATNATLRIVAWPNYQDVSSICAILHIAVPLIGNRDSVLCFRHDPAIDIPLLAMQANLQEAFAALHRQEELNILIVDDVIPDSNLPRLGRSLTCALHTELSPHPVRARFFTKLGIEIISGREPL